MVCIAIDASGGDHGIQATIPGAARFLKRTQNVSFIFFGDEGAIRPVISRYSALRDASTIHHTRHFVANDEKPSTALRTGRESSMRLAINAVKNGEADAIVSAGNTGALMAMSKLVLKTLPNIRRPAIASLFPTMDDKTVFLDLGANLFCDAEVLVQFALLGVIYAKEIEGVSNPTVGLLNVGSEDMKGHEELRAAATVLKEIDFPGQYIGFIEGNDIPMGKVDVVVTDGFTGNIALKTAEGVSKLTKHFVRQAFMSTPLAWLGGLLSYRALNKIRKRVDPREYNGGMFLGLDGICVKSHGNSDDVAFSNALRLAHGLVKTGFNKKVSEETIKLIDQEIFLGTQLQTA